MAQLRDAETSECVFEGTPLEVAAVAAELGNDVIFDDVGTKFDPAAVLKAHDENVSGLEVTAKDTKTDKSTRDSARDAAKQAKAEVEGAKKNVAKIRKLLR